MKNIIKLQNLLLGITSLVLVFGSYGSVIAAAPEASNVNCQFDQSSTEFCNPIPDQNVPDLFYRLAKFFLGIMAGAAVVIIVVAGFRMIISSGNEEQVKAAKGAMTWALIGLIIALLAYSFVAILQNVLQGSTN